MIDELLSARLHAQLLAGDHEEIKEPPHVVQAMGAMQAQEYAMAKWAVGLRLPHSTAADVEDSFQRGGILRTHVLRPTWHFVHPDDIRWLLKLTAPHVHAKNRYMYKKLELDTDVLCQACSIMENTLERGPCTREELQQQLAAAGIQGQGHRLSYMMMYAELEGLIASGARRGKQFTYALMDNVAPQCRGYSHTEMLAMLARRYFASRAPATVRDFAYWSGLSVKNAQIGAQALGKGFYLQKYAQSEYVFAEGYKQKPAPEMPEGHAVFLMPDYDEYGMSYKDRRGLISFAQEMAKESDYSHWLIVDGVIAGTWSPATNGAEPEIRLFGQTPMTHRRAEMERAQWRYLQFWAQLPS